MVDKVLHYGLTVKGGVTADGKLVVPRLAADPGAPADGSIWLNETDDVLRARIGGSTIDLNTGLDTEAVIDAIATALVAGTNIDITYNDAAGTITFDVEALTSGDIGDFVAAARAAITVADSATLDLTYAVGQITGAVLDSPLLGGETKGAIRARGSHTGTQAAATISDFAAAVAALSIDADTLEGMTAAQLQAAVTQAIVDGAPGTLDTLNELAAALQDNPDVISEILAALAARSRFFAVTLDGGTDSEVVTHNLNTKDVVVQFYSATTGDADDDYKVQRTTVDTVTISTEDGTNLPADLRVVITTAA